MEHNVNDRSSVIQQCSKLRRNAIVTWPRMAEQYTILNDIIIYCLSFKGNLSYIKKTKIYIHTNPKGKPGTGKKGFLERYHSILSRDKPPAPLDENNATPAAEGLPDTHMQSQNLYIISEKYIVNASENHIRSNRKGKVDP